MRKIFRKRTQSLILSALMCVMLFTFLAYKEIRQDQKIVAEWRGQEAAMEAMELPPGLSRAMRVLFLVAVGLSLTAAGFTISDFRRFRRQHNVSAQLSNRSHD